jgi:predicted cupin superfamily sugar epimerase
MKKMNKTAEYYIEKLKLEKHPEGGAFKEIYRSGGEIQADALPERFGGARAFSTSIYFLLKGDEISAFHRIKSDEIWHFYDGSAATIYIIDEQGNLTEKVIGNNPEAGESFQAVVPLNCWFAARVNNSAGFMLAGCTVSPGFDFHDFELGLRRGLIEKFPQFRELIEQLTNN